MESKDLVRFIHMFDSGKTVLAFTEGRCVDDLDTDRQLYGAVIRELCVIGEAANQISEAMQIRFSDIPWKDIISMRNRLIHSYFNIDQDVIWGTATIYVPALLKQLKEIIPILKDEFSAEEASIPPN